jgi:hypothetical protein
MGLITLNHRYNPVNIPIAREANAGCQTTALLYGAPGMHGVA